TAYNSILTLILDISYQNFIFSVKKFQKVEFKLAKWNLLLQFTLFYIPFLYLLFLTFYPQSVL
ncbi:MAG: hypothetical protein PHE02_11235, partial [Lachnospiraceae bacterium]|nr:hypothetical protein [Lachnospiraceae bacterium]